MSWFRLDLLLHFWFSSDSSVFLNWSVLSSVCRSFNFASSGFVSQREFLFVINSGFFSADKMHLIIHSRLVRLANKKIRTVIRVKPPLSTFPGRTLPQPVAGGGDWLRRQVWNSWTPNLPSAVPQPAVFLLLLRLHDSAPEQQQDSHVRMEASVRRNRYLHGELRSCRRIRILLRINL